MAALGIKGDARLPRRGVNVAMDLEPTAHQPAGHAGLQWTCAAWARNAGLDDAAAPRTGAPKLRAPLAGAALSQGRLSKP